MRLVPKIGLVASSIRTNGDASLFSPTTFSEFMDSIVIARRPVAVVAGGTDICAQCNEGADFGSFIDINGLPDLRIVSLENGSLRVGSALSLFEASNHPLIVRTLPGFATALGEIANVRVRFRATVGGNIMARRPRYELSVLALAARASMRLRDPQGVVTRSMEDFLGSPTPGDCLLESLILPANDWVDFHYDRSLRPTMTLCFSAIRNGERIDGRTVIATEYCAPLAMRVDLGEGLSPQSDVDAIADRAFGGFPDGFGDHVSSNWYLRNAGKALLVRRLRALVNGG